MRSRSPSGSSQLLVTIHFCPGKRKHKAPRGNYRELLWQQGAPGRHHQGRQSVSAPDAGRWCMAVIRHAEPNGARRAVARTIAGTLGDEAAAIALANKTARIVWALMTSGECYRDAPGVPSLSAQINSCVEKTGRRGWEGQTGANAQSRLVRDYEQRLDVSEAMIFLGMGICSSAGSLIHDILKRTLSCPKADRSLQAERRARAIRWVAP